MVILLLKPNQSESILINNNEKQSKTLFAHSTNEESIYFSKMNIQKYHEKENSKIFGI